MNPEYFSPRLAEFLKTYQKIDGDLKIALREMSGQSRLRPEFTSPYNRVKESLTKLNHQISTGELPEVYRTLISPLNEGMDKARELRNQIAHNSNRRITPRRITL